MDNLEKLLEIIRWCSENTTAVFFILLAFFVTVLYFGVRKRSGRKW